MSEAIKVFLSDWQVLFREGIHFTLSAEEDLVVTGEATGNTEALAFITENYPDIAIVNINHSSFTGDTLTRQVRRDYPLVSMILVMDTDNEDQIYVALKCGAAACVAKDIDPEELVGQIRQIAKGNMPIKRAILRPGIAARVLGEFESFSKLSKDIENLLAKLTPVEKSILNSIAEGETIDEIETATGVTGEKLDAYLGVIRGKLEENEHCRDVVEASEKDISSVIKRAGHKKGTEEFISREEFDEFRDSLIEHFRTFTETFRAPGEH